MGSSVDYTAKGRLRELEDTPIKIPQTEVQREKNHEKKKNRKKEYIQELWDNYQRFNIHVMRLQKEKEREEKKRLK